MSGRYAADTMDSEFPGEWRVVDTTTDTRIATCFNSADADLIVAALNEARATAEAGGAPTPATLGAPIHGVCWVLIRDGSVLMERCEKKARVLGVGEWFIPGGKIEGAESPYQALLREIWEEWPEVALGTISPLPIVEGSPVPPGPRGVFLMRPYSVEIIGAAPQQSSEGVPLRWVPISEALVSPVPQVRMMVAAALDSCATPTLRAPEVSDADVQRLTFDELLATANPASYGLSSKNPENTVPWSWYLLGGIPVTHENDDCYIVGTVHVHRGETVCIARQRIWTERETAPTGLRPSSGGDR